MATIKPIEGRTVHQIQSGQVIVDLSSVVKELVENSLDAGATSIELRFKNQGLDSIEVQDNGDGISPQNYETLALKHHTSKLSTYSDLTTLQTFGFRGEALSSLCALSSFSVITCMAQDAPKGTKLDFEVSGKLKGTSVIAAQKGTTVSVESLFKNLPVRRKELERNIKREWNRVIGVLGQYACIQTGIKFSVTQQAGKGKKTTLFSTKGNQTTKENLINVFGAKTLTALVPLDLKLELEPTSGPGQKWSAQQVGGKTDINIVGHISRPVSGDGRQLPDRQMFFVNARPCGLPQVAKAFNEVYKSYNGSQSPFIFANIELDTHMYDVNVSPDKRTILLHDQNRMLENLKIALVELFDSHDYTVPVTQLPTQKRPSYKQLTFNHESSASSITEATSPQTHSAEEEESEDDSSTRERTADKEEQRMTYNHRSRNVPVSLEPMSKDREAVNLISNWASRNVKDRPGQKADISRPAKNELAGLSKHKQRIEILGEGNEKAMVQPTNDRDSSLVTTQSTTATPSQEAPVLVDDSDQSSIESPKNQASPGRSVPTAPEAPIPALQSPVKPSSSIADRFSSSIRPQRSQGEMATITIGDHTITSNIGTPYPKRPRIEHPTGISRNSKQRRDPAAPLPSFGNNLSQRFAAPGTLAQHFESEEESEDEIEDSALSPEARDESPMESIRTANDDSSQEEQAREMESTAESLNEKDSDLSLIPSENEDDEEYIDENEKKILEEAKVQEMIEDVEKAAALHSQEKVIRAKSLLKGGSKKKDATLNLVHHINITESEIGQQFRTLEERLSQYQALTTQETEDEALKSDQAEEKLSLTISKTDFAQMKIVGQFNLGFILASRVSERKLEEWQPVADDLFIIDQHASDEKYNFERLQATTIVQSQKLVYPKTLDLTALEEEIVIENLAALETNGFLVTVDESGESPVGKRCQLVSLPLSKETTFSLSDLEELLALLAEQTPGAIPRPSKTRKMFAMRACRSSIMIGKTLTHKQMEKVVQHLGELDKPWNCPHGRPTMRHLCGLGVWDELGWKEFNEARDENIEPTNWAAYVRQN